VEKMDINPMNVQIERKKEVKLTLPKNKDEMLRQKITDDEKSSLNAREGGK
jgi:hypothetical protein